MPIRYNGCWCDLDAKQIEAYGLGPPPGCPLCMEEVLFEGETLVATYHLPGEPPAAEEALDASKPE